MCVIQGRGCVIAEYLVCNKAIANQSTKAGMLEASLAQGSSLDLYWSGVGLQKKLWHSSRLLLVWR
jgi:hypothetical protein